MHGTMNISTDLKGDFGTLGISTDLKVRCLVLLVHILTYRGDDLDSVY